MLKKVLSCFLCVIFMITITACESEAEKSGDYLSGNKWESSDGTMLALYDDNTFKWFKSSANREDNYYVGTYEVMAGQDAINHLSNEYGLDENGQKSTLTQFSVSLDEYYVLILNNDQRITDGENTLEEPVSFTYYGYYRPDYETLNIYKIDTMNEYQFKKK